MLNIARNILLFFAGVLLAVLFVYQGGVQAVSSLFASPADSVAQNPTTAETPRGRLQDDLVEKNSRLQVFDSTVSAERREDILLDALREGSFESLQLLRSEYVRDLPEYRDSLLPALKKESLNGMLSRFIESDWTDWHSSFSSRAGSPSLARLFVEDLKGVNTDIGMFLETAAFLLSGLATNTAEGRVFDVSQQMSYLLDNAEQLLSARKLKAMPARYVFQPEVSTDPAFRTVLERERGRFVAIYLKRSPQNMKAALRLLGSLEPRLIGRDSYRTIAKYLVYVATGASPRLREAFLFADLEDGTLNALAEQDKGVRKTLSLLYVMAAVDSIESGDTLQANKFLHQSVAIQPGQRIQRVVAQALKESPDEASLILPKPKKLPRAVTSEATTEADTEETPKREVRDEATVDWIMLGALLMFFCAVPLVVIYLLNRYRLKDLRYIQDKLSSNKGGPVGREAEWEAEEAAETPENPRDRLKAVG